MGILLEYSKLDNEIIKAKSFIALAYCVNDEENYKLLTSKSMLLNLYSIYGYFFWMIRFFR